MTSNAETYEGAAVSFRNELTNELLSLVDVKEGSVVLDIGCGNGNIASILAEKVKSFMCFDFI